MARLLEIKDDVFQNEEITRDQQIYNPSDKIWRFKDNTSSQNLNFEQFEDKLSPELLNNLKRVFIHRLRNFSVGGARNILYSFSSSLIIADTPLEEIKLEHLDLKNAAIWKKIPTLISYWYELGISGVSELTYQQVRRIKKPKQDCGKAVRNHDPRTAQLTAEEVELLVNRINLLYSEDKITTEDYLIIAILLCTGMRGAQLVALRCSSLVGDELYIPKIKNNAPLYRDLAPHQLSPALSIWRLLHRYVEDVVEKTDGDGDAPMFSYQTSSCLRANIHKINKNLIKLYSDRLPEGELMPITPMRFRHTIATKMAEAGKGVEAIAQTLTHNCINSCQVYVDGTATRDGKISDVMSPKLKPLAQACCNEIIEDESEFPDPLGGRTKMDKRVQYGPKGAVGNCGKCGSCSARAPISCYTCSMFHPWAHAPHREVYEDFMREREETGEFTNSIEVTTVTDLSLRSILYVIEACEERNREKYE
tara:strand:- start:767 stop:2200 length:1434 start_codon:yes stop_codon:yes gene_type:complete